MLRRFGMPERLYAPDAGGGAAPAPVAAEPSAAPASSEPSAPSVPSASPSSQNDEFSGLGLLDDDLDSIPELPKDSAPAVTPAAATPPPPAAAPQTPPAPQPKAEAAAPPVPPQQPGPQEPAGGQQPPPSSPAEPQSFAERMDANRDAIVEQLAKDVFALSKEDAEAFELDPVGHLPRMQAKVLFQSIKAARNHIETLVPQLIEQHLSAVRQRDAVESAFYGKFKALDKEKHHADVVQFAKTFRQVNAQISQDELWSLVAASVMAKHGLAAPNGSGAPPRPPATEPFVPARPGAVVRTTPEPDNPFIGMGRDYEED